MKKFLLGFLVGAVLFAAIPIGAAISEYKLAASTVKITVDGSAMEAESPPILYMSPGYNYIPAKLFREICAKIGVGFDWISETNTIEIVTEKEDKEPVKEDTKEPAKGEVMPSTEALSNGITVIYTEWPERYRDDGYVVIDCDGKKYGWLVNLSAHAKGLGYGSDDIGVCLKNPYSNEIIMKNIPCIAIPHQGKGKEDVDLSTCYIEMEYFKSEILPKVLMD